MLAQQLARLIVERLVYVDHTHSVVERVVAHVHLPDAEWPAELDTAALDLHGNISDVQIDLAVGGPARPAAAPLGVNWLPAGSTRQSNTVALGNAAHPPPTSDFKVS